MSILIHLSVHQLPHWSQGDQDNCLMFLSSIIKSNNHGEHPANNGGGPYMLRPHCCSMRRIATGPTFQKVGGIIHWAERYQGAASVRAPTGYTDPNLMAVSRTVLWWEGEEGEAEGGQHQSEEHVCRRGILHPCLELPSSGLLLINSSCNHPLKPEIQVTILSYLTAPNGFPLHWRFWLPWLTRQRDGSLWLHLKPSSLSLPCSLTGFSGFLKLGFILFMIRPS